MLAVKGVREPMKNSLSNIPAEPSNSDLLADQDKPTPSATN